MGEGERVVDRTVPPADVARILLLRVLCVVEQQIDTAGQIHTRRPFRLERKSPRAESGLVIGQVRQRGARGLNAVADGRPWMAHPAGRNQKGADRYRPSNDVV